MEGRERPNEPRVRAARARSGLARQRQADVAAWLRAAARDLAVYAARKLDRGARWTVRLVRRRPQAAGIVGLTVLLGATLGYGIHRGEHSAVSLEALKALRDHAANAAGFKIETLAITGRNQLSEADILATAGITENTSLLFLDVGDVRQRLEAMPWIGRANVRKLYPNHLEIAVEERQAFALWQMNGKLSLIASDGTVLGPLEGRGIPRLPLVVGPGAAAKAQSFLATLEGYPVLRDQMRAAILVADRRWNLKLKNGLDIRLPETEIEKALETLLALDRDKKILSRDLTAIDLRLPERLTVRLSDEAAQAREQSIKDKKKRKGGDA